MSYCRPVNEIGYLGPDWIPSKLKKYARDSYGELDFVLLVRNGGIDGFMYDDNIPENEKLELSDMSAEVLEMLTINGFIRPIIRRMLFSADVPNSELYFIRKYIIEPKLIEEFALRHESLGGYQDVDVEDYREALMPYFYSNKAYEKYDLCCDGRIEATINLLSNYLDEDELYDVMLDIRGAGDFICDKKIFKRVCGKLKDECLDFIPKLVQAFEMY